MSNLFSGNQPPFPKKDERQTGTSPFAGGRAPVGEQETAGTEPRPPLFPRRDAEPAKPAPSGLFPSRTAPAADAGTREVKAPLFPKKDEPRTPSFPSRTAEPAQARPSLFPKKDENAPLFPSRTTGGTAQAGAARPSLFPPKQDAPQERKPLFPPRPAAQPAAPERPLFGARPAAGQEPARPLFGAKAPTPTGQDRPLFGAKAAQQDKPLFRTNPAAPAKPMFSTTPAAPGPSSLGASVSGEIKVTDQEFIQLRDFLYQQCGIFIAENRKYLVENRLASRLRELGLRSFGEYYKYLRFDSNKDTELNKLYEYMTTNETSFFRNGPQLDVFRDKVLKKVLDELRAKGQKKLRIWSAGCSSGEEPYTLAMIISDLLRQELPSWDIKITANDLSLAMLAAARRGVYNDYAIRTTPKDILDRYFTKENGLYRIDPQLTKLISFGQINLNDKAQLQKVERSQIVFCRNVIIYFDDDMKRNVINAFYDNLLPGGYLLIGHSESLHNISRAFKPEHYSGSIVYCKQS